MEGYKKTGFFHVLEMCKLILTVIFVKIHIWRGEWAFVINKLLTKILEWPFWISYKVRFFFFSIVVYYKWQHVGNKIIIILIKHIKAYISAKLGNTYTQTNSGTLKIIIIKERNSNLKNIMLRKLNI